MHAKFFFRDVCVLVPRTAKQDLRRADFDAEMVATWISPLQTGAQSFGMGCMRHSVTVLLGRRRTEDKHTGRNLLGSQATLGLEDRMGRGLPKGNGHVLGTSPGPLLRTSPTPASCLLPCSISIIRIMSPASEI